MSARRFITPTKSFHREAISFRRLTISLSTPSISECRPDKAVVRLVSAAGRCGCGCGS